MTTNGRLHPVGIHVRRPAKTPAHRCDRLEHPVARSNRLSRESLPPIRVCNLNAPTRSTKVCVVRKHSGATHARPTRPAVRLNFSRLPGRSVAETQQEGNSRVTVHDAGRSDAGGCLELWSRVVVAEMNSKMLRDYCRQVGGQQGLDEAASLRALGAEAELASDPARRRASSLALFVGATFSWSRNVQSHWWCCNSSWQVPEVLG